MGFPCPMCVHEPKRYEKVGGACISDKGCSKVANIIQHLIKRHLHICRVCTQVLIKPTDNDKSVTRYNAILKAHTDCVPKKWPAKYDSEEPQILSKKQQATVLGWDRKKALDSCTTTNTKGEAAEEALYKDLYMALHGKPLREGGTTWTYMVPAHKQEELVRAAVSKECATLKRKLEEAERENKRLTKAESGRQWQPHADAHDLSHASRWEKDPARARQLDIPGEIPQYVDPQSTLLDSRGHDEEIEELLMKDLEEKIPDGNFLDVAMSLDSGYQSKNQWHEL